MYEYISVIYNVTYLIFKTVAEITDAKLAKMLFIKGNEIRA